MGCLCSVDIHIKGKKKNCYFIAASIPTTEEGLVVVKESGDEDNFVLWCKGEMQAPYSADDSQTYYSEEWGNRKFDFDNWEYEDIESANEELYDFYNISLLEKSRVLNCEIQIYSALEDDEMYYEKYKDGKCTYARYTYITVWDKNEIETEEDYCDEYELTEEEFKLIKFSEIGKNVYAGESLISGEKVPFSFDF